jgi:hypothetical protein
LVDESRHCHTTNDDIASHHNTPRQAAMLADNAMMLTRLDPTFWFLTTLIVGYMQFAYSLMGDETTRKRHTFFGSAILAWIEPITVVKCSIALDVTNRDDPSSILSVLDHIAEAKGKANTYENDVLSTKQVALEILRRKAKIHSASYT